MLLVYLHFLLFLCEHVCICRLCLSVVLLPSDVYVCTAPSLFHLTLPTWWILPGSLVFLSASLKTVCTCHCRKGYVKVMAYLVDKTNYNVNATANLMMASHCCWYMCSRISITDKWWGFDLCMCSPLVKWLCVHRFVWISTISAYLEWVSYFFCLTQTLPLICKHYRWWFECLMM